MISILSRTTYILSIYNLYMYLYLFIIYKYKHLSIFSQSVYAIIHHHNIFQCMYIHTLSFQLNYFFLQLLGSRMTDLADLVEGRSPK